MNSTCAPSKTFSNGSCFTLESLLEMSKSYNKLHDDKIEIENNKNHLVKELTTKLKPKCDDNQHCWLDQKFVKILKSDEINENTFRPKGPREGTQWLSNIDIVNVMDQYHKIYPNFQFLGAVPIDFNENLGVSAKIVKNFLNKNKTKFGVVFNTDPSTKSGQHWNSLYCDFEKGQIYFFDSVGVEPLTQVRSFVSKLVELIYKKKFGEKINVNGVIKYLKNEDKNKKYENQVNKLLTIDIRYNPIRHQFKNSECGVYSMNFILRLLKGESFDQITKNITDDDKINKCRQVYFTG
jgi:hypothetical protein